MDGKSVVIDILGWFGALGILGAYALVSTRRVEGDSLKYQTLNIIGSLLLAINTVHYGAYPSALVNALWIAIAVYSVRKALKRLISALPGPKEGGTRA